MLSKVRLPAQVCLVRHAAEGERLYMTLGMYTYECDYVAQAVKEIITCIPLVCVQWTPVLFVYMTWLVLLY